MPTPPTQERFGVRRLILKVDPLRQLTVGRISSTNQQTPFKGSSDRQPIAEHIERHVTIVFLLTDVVTSFWKSSVRSNDRVCFCTVFYFCANVNERWRLTENITGFPAFMIRRHKKTGMVCYVYVAFTNAGELASCDT